MAEEYLSLQWMDHSNIFSQSIGTLRNKNLFTDATLACEGKFYPIHKFVLSTCSEYFNAIFEYTPCVNPVVVINNIPCNELEPLLDFMYKGEATVSENLLKGVMKAAEWLCIKGLSIESSGISFYPKEKESPGVEKTMEPKKRRNRSNSRKRPIKQSKTDIKQEQLTPPSAKDIIPASLSAEGPSNMLPSSLNITTPTSPAVNNISCSSSVSDSSFSSGMFSSSLNPLPIISSVFSTKNEMCPTSPNSLSFKGDDPNDVSNIQGDQNNGHPITSIADHPYHSLKEEGDSLNLAALPHLTSNGASQILSPATEHQYAKYEGPLMVPEGPSNENLSIEDVPHLHPIDQKLIGEEINLDGPVKDLHITTEDGTVTIPEILEGLVEMPSLYDSKMTDPREVESNDTNDSLYDFNEDFQDSPLLNKDKILRTFSNPQTKRKFLTPEPQPEATRVLQFSMTSPMESTSNNTSKPVIVDKKEPKPSFVCLTCNKTYSKKKLLTRHMLTHTEFPYSCTICHRKFKTYKELINHRKGHADKRCDKCDFVTIRADALRRHMTSHEAKSHKCPYPDCLQAFTNSEQLKKHLTIHEKRKDLPSDSKIPS